MTMDTATALLCAFLAASAAGAGVLLGWPAWRRLRARRAARDARIAAIEASYERDMGR